jgi:hypothetical protein
MQASTMIHLKGFSPKTLAVAALMALTGLATLAPAQTPIKVLFWGGTTTDPHHPTRLRDTLANYFPAFNIQMDYRSANVPVWLHADTLAQYDVILVYTTHNTSQAANDLGQARLTALTNWINSGRVMVALHGSTNTYTMGNYTFTAEWRALPARQEDHRHLRHRRQGHPPARPPRGQRGLHAR